MEGRVSNKDWGKIIKLSKEANGAEKIVHFLADIFYQQGNTKTTKVVVEKVIKPNGKLKDIAASLRKKRLQNSTKSEVLFASMLEKAGIRHKREHIFYPRKSFYIVDFFIPEVKLVIEIDGGYHDEEDQEIRDVDRTSKLINECGVREVLRFKNEDLFNKDSCLKILKESINKLKDSNYRNLIK